MSCPQQAPTEIICFVSLQLYSLHKGALLDHRPNVGQPVILLHQHRLPGVHADLLQLLVARGEVRQEERGVPVRNGLQDGIVDECVLLLW